MVLNLFILLTICSGIVFSGSESRASDEQLEYRLKAAFLLNFAKFTSWPEKEIWGKEKFTFCILGSNHFGQALEGIKKKSVAGRPIELVYSEETDVTAACQLVYLNISERRKLPHILSQLGQKSVLTVSGMKGFAKAGGIIEFVPMGTRVGFIINLTEAKKNELQLSSSLLNLATKVL
ncbi:MAG: YfiR family protein [Desulfobulbaceae bacterium]|nr:YfiR family protein [Desulfobulbaceae bacterium]